MHARTRCRIDAGENIKGTNAIEVFFVIFLMLVGAFLFAMLFGSVTGDTTPPVPQCHDRPFPRMCATTGAHRIEKVRPLRAVVTAPAQRWWECNATSMADELERCWPVLVRHSSGTLRCQSDSSVGIAFSGAGLCAAVLVQDTADEKSWLASSMASLRQVGSANRAQCSAGC